MIYFLPLIFALLGCSGASIHWQQGSTGSSLSVNVNSEALVLDPSNSLFLPVSGGVSPYACSCTLPGCVASGGTNGCTYQAPSSTVGISNALTIKTAVQTDQITITDWLGNSLNPVTVTISSPGLDPTYSSAQGFLSEPTAITSNGVPVFISSDPSGDTLLTFASATTLKTYEVTSAGLLDFVPAQQDSLPVVSLLDGVTMDANGDTIFYGNLGSNATGMARFQLSPTSTTAQPASFSPTPLSPTIASLPQIVGGQICIISAVYNTGGSITLSRSLPSGSPDTTFSSLLINVGDYSGTLPPVASLAVQPGTGEIILMGVSNTTVTFNQETAGNDTSASLASTTTGPQIFLFRISPNGVLDNAFGTSGGTGTPVNNSSSLAAMALQSTGAILIASDAFTANINQFQVMRFAANGTLDPNFGVSGIVTVPSFTEIEGAPASTDQVTSIAVSNDDSIYLAGSTTYNGSTTFGVASLDGSGKITAQVSQSFSQGEEIDKPTAILVQSTGANGAYAQILVAGSSYANAAENVVLARFLMP